MQPSERFSFAFFFCHRLDVDYDRSLRRVEEKFGDQLKFFPLPCSGRIEPLHLLRSLEEGTDKVYLLTCPEGLCRYQQGNLRARKRLIYTKNILEEIGINGDRVEVISSYGRIKEDIGRIIEELIARDSPSITPSPLKEKGALR